MKDFNNNSSKIKKIQNFNINNNFNNNGNNNSLYDKIFFNNFINSNNNPKIQNHGKIF